jgi:hypothetical protein
MGHITDQGSDIDMMRIESGMSFLWVKSSMIMMEKLRQVRCAIYVNRREIAHTLLEVVARLTTPTAS